MSVRPSALTRAVVVGATVVICWAISPEVAANDVEIDFDSESTGGDGVAGQVIGSVAPGRSIVIATTESSHTTGIGGHSRTTSDVEIFGLDPEDEGVAGWSAESVGGDGIAKQVAGVDPPGIATDEEPDGLARIVLHDIAP